MGMFRPSLDTDDGKAPVKKPSGKKGIASSRPPTGDIKELEKAYKRAEKRLIRARGRVEHIESDLLLADDPDDIEDLKAELSEATKKKDAALRKWETTRQELNDAKARQKAEASFKEEELIEVPKPVEKKAPKKRSKRSSKGAKVSFADVKPEDLEGMEAEAIDDDHMEVGEAIDLDELDAFEAELVTDDLEAPRPRKKGFKWTPKKAIAVGVILFLVLPVLLYGLVIPRADVTVKTWYYEGFQNSIVIDAKVQNHGTVDIKGLDLNISVLKVVDDVEVYITELTFSDPLIYAREEQKVESVTFHDDQNDEYIVLVQVTYEAGGKLVDESYTHHIDKPYMNVVFEDNVFMWAF
jgi:hypothetical protein